jgi:hypothetical protein
MKSPRVTRPPKRRRKSPNKRELAEMKALSNLGNTPYAISKRTGIDDGTVAKYLADQEAYNNPQMQTLVTEIMAKEIMDLTVLTVKARQRLHEIAPRLNAIESIALMDRTFQQRRLLEGKSTSNIATLQKVIRDANKDLAD